MPNPRDVEQACYYGKHMEMQDGSAVLNLTPWSPNVGAKAPLQKAWVRVQNIPEEKRCLANIAYARSLVGVTLEVDTAMMFKPEYARILLGCANVDKIPPSAEGVLGDDFYDFFYDVEKIVVGPPGKDKVAISASSDGTSSTKRMRTEALVKFLLVLL